MPPHGPPPKRIEELAALYLLGLLEGDDLREFEHFVHTLGETMPPANLKDTLLDRIAPKINSPLRDPPGKPRRKDP